MDTSCSLFPCAPWLMMKVHVYRTCVNVLLLCDIQGFILRKIEWAFTDSILEDFKINTRELIQGFVENWLIITRTIRFKFWASKKRIWTLLNVKCRSFLFRQKVYMYTYVDIVLNKLVKNKKYTEGSFLYFKFLYQFQKFYGLLSLIVLVKIINILVFGRVALYVIYSISNDA